MAFDLRAKGLLYGREPQQPDEVVHFQLPQPPPLERPEGQDKVAGLVLDAVPPLLADALAREPGVLFGNLVEDALLDPRQQTPPLDVQDVPPDVRQAQVVGAVQPIH